MRLDMSHPAGSFRDKNPVGAGSGRDRREGWALRPVNRPALRSWAYRRWQARRWAYDHGAHWSEQIGDMLARPWMRLSRWCYQRWLEMQ